jgi:predicted ATPase with chaperone activity
MSATATLERTESLVSALGLDDGFQPQEPSTLKETGLSEALVEDLVLKFLSGVGSESGRGISNVLCLPLGILEDRFTALRNRQEIAPSGAAMLGDHVYRLTEVGRDRALRAMKESAYVGPAPVPLDDYVNSVQAQTIASERPRKPQLEKAFSDIHVEAKMLSQLGPAINAGKGMFIYGPPGNGKTTIAQRITRCFGQNILIPHAIIEGGKVIKMFDAACHRAVRSAAESLFRTAEFDRRWIRIERPTVVVGGELTMESLELKHDLNSGVSEASLQLKSNCGCLLIDDFGRQRINPTELLNRWIIPLENRVDYLSLSNGRKIQVPFEQLIIFSTNLEPHDLADDAFLRRIPFKVEIGDPSPQEFHLLFQVFAKKHQLECPPHMVDYLIGEHYQKQKRPLRRCHARDLLEQVIYYCNYNELPLEITEEYLTHAVQTYFTALKGD